MSERSRSPAEVRPKRGIRGGAAARRKREAYLRHQEALGYDRNKVGIVHAGGLARPFILRARGSPSLQLTRRVWSLWILKGCNRIWWISWI